jgi:hypothetical protein
MTATSIKVDWSPMTANNFTGGSAIISYSLEWDLSVGNWQQLTVNPSLALTYTVNSGIIAGQVYSFRLKAQNQYGWGPYSEIIVATPSSVPSQMQ